MKISTIAIPLIALIALLVEVQAQAQSEPEQDTHHTQAETAPPDTGGGMSMPSMVGNSSMPMMAQPGMCSMMGMMGMPQGNGMTSADPFAHIEGRIAYLKAELKITPVQEDKWNAFAEVLRGSATQMKLLHDEMSSDKARSWEDGLSQHEKMLVTHLNLIKAARAAAEPLFASFSDEQRKLADELLSGPMGIIR